MYRIDDKTAVSSLPALPTDDVAGPGFFTGGNPGASPPVLPTRVRFWWLNLVQESLISLLAATGLAPSKSDSTLVLQAVSLIGRRSAIFSASGSFTVPAGVYILEVTVYGGGGGSGGTYNSNSASVGGGGGGWARRVVQVTPGAVYAMTVGAGGVAGVAAASPTAGGAGGTSSFGTLVSATGGQGGAGNANTAMAAVVVAAGGYGVGGDDNRSGASSDGPFSISGGVVTGRGGACGGDGGAGGHSGATGVSAGGIPGNFPGGGASGSGAQANGAAGAGGLIIVRY